MKYKDSVLRPRNRSMGERLRAAGFNRIVLHFSLMAVTGIVLAPYLWAVATSLKKRQEVFTSVPQWIPESPTWSNYADIFKIAPFGIYLINTIIVVAGILIVQLVTSVLAAYVFARVRFWGSNFLFALFLVQMMMPIHAVIVPNYLTVQSLGLLDTRAAMMIPFWASGYAVFLLRQAFRQVPKEFEDAATMDGAGPLRFLWSVLLPQAKPTLIAFGLISVVTHWNDFLWPLIVTDSPAVRTLTIGLAMFVQQESGADWPLLMAATVLVTAPLLVLFVIYQRRFVESFMHSGLKG